MARRRSGLRLIWRAMDVLFLAVAVGLLALLVQGYAGKGGWIGRAGYASIGENAWRERIVVLTWRRDALELHVDRTFIRILDKDDCDICGAFGEDRWESHFTIARLRTRHPSDWRRHLSIGTRVREPDPSQREVTIHMPHWLPVVVLALPFTINTIRRKRSDPLPKTDR